MVMAVFRPEAELTLFLRMRTPKHGKNVSEKNRYLSVTGNLHRRSEWRCQIFDRKFLNSRFCACAMKMYAKLAYGVVKSPKF